MAKVSMALTGKQKGMLRGLGQNLDVAVTVGKGGVGQPFIAEMNRLLDGRELVKARFPAGPRDERHGAAAGVSTACDAELVGEVGRTALFYRPNAHLAPSKRVNLDPGE